MFFVPGAGQMELASKTQRWTQWGPFLIVDEYVGWYQEAIQLRENVVIGDWSPICKFNVSGPDVHPFMRFIQTRKDFADIEVGQSMYTVQPDTAAGVLVRPHQRGLDRAGNRSRHQMGWRRTPDDGHAGHGGRPSIRVAQAGHRAHLIGRRCS